MGTAKNVSQQMLMQHATSLYHSQNLMQTKTPALKNRRNESEATVWWTGIAMVKF